MVGWGGAFGLVGGELASAARVRSISRVLVFKLGGKATLPPLPPEPAPVEPPPLTASAETVDKGRTLYHRNCVFCHGGAAVGGGVIPDLRKLDAKRHESFDRIVRGGIPGKGMPSFAGALTADDVRAIQAYIIKRANDEKVERESSGRK